MTPDKQLVIESIDAKRALLLDLTCRLISCDSVCGNEREAQMLIRSELEKIGCDIDEWEIDIDELSKSSGYASQEGLSFKGRPSIVGIWHGREDRNSLIINGHIDVVEADNADAWRTPPFSPLIENGRIYGRGSADMKGGIAASIVAIQTLHELGFNPKGNIIYESAVGEEESVNGTLALCARGYRAEMAVIAECTDMAIMPANLGTISFNIEIPGMQAHHGLCYEGENAIEHAFTVYRALKSFEAMRTEKISNPLFACYRIPATINMGRLEAGVDRWACAGHAIIEGCCEYYPHESAETVWQEMQDFVLASISSDEWLSKNPPLFRWMMKSYASQCENDRVVELLSSAYRLVRKKEPSIRGLPCGADMSVMNLYADTPTVLLGPGSIYEAHTENESVLIEDVVDCSKIFALLMLER